MPAEMWVDVLVKGYVDQSAIRYEIGSSAFVLGRASQPTWRRLWSIHDETDADADMLIADVEAKFAKREYVVPGEIAHVLARRLTGRPVIHDREP